ncbi:MAG: sodium pump decarboxylase gamma subunit [Lachnospiraceae bacterium]|nr:sodium pump decarboxylase gamma subunit [Lachnospiraceae bacterium]MBQ6855552.1 sodium pump decarboxylase gamma subunit [Lachnospiraceae bacterium]
MNEVLVQAFNMMWQGMAGIMVVMGILAGVVAALTKVGNKKN